MGIQVLYARQVVLSTPADQQFLKELGVTDSAVRNHQRQTGALPPAVYTQQHNFNIEDLMAGLANDPNTKGRVAFTRNEEGEFVQATSEGGDVTEATFVDDCLVAVAVAKA